MEWGEQVGGLEKTEEVGAPDTARVMQRGQSEEPASVNLFLPTLQIWEAHHGPWQLQSLRDCCEVCWAH